MREICVTSIGVTVITHSALTLPVCAVIVVVPTDMAVIFPLETEATLVLDEDHVIVLSVAFWGVIVALNVIDSPITRVADVLLSVIDVASIGFTVTVHCAFMFPT